MDCLATFPDTITVMQAEQILTRKQIPFETVPYSRFNRNRCGLAILFSEKYAERVKVALEEAQVKFDLVSL